MKKAKILAISSIFALLMCACGNTQTSSKTDENAFDYTAPTITFDGVGEEQIDLSGNDKIKKIVEAFPKQEASQEEKDAYNLKLVKALADNDIAAKKVEGKIIEYNKRLYGGLDTRNFDKKTSFTIARDDANKNLHGTFAYEKKSFKEVIKEGTTDQKEVVANDPISLTGTYDVGVKETNGSRKIEKVTAFDNNAKESETVTSGYNVYNLVNALRVYPLIDFKNDFVNKTKGDQVDVNKYDYSHSFTSTLDSEGAVTIELKNILKNKAIDEDSQIIERTDIYLAKVSKAGVVLNAYHLHEDVCTNYRATPTAEISSLSLEKIEENYTFTA